jgi:hypothetical protein
MLHAKYLAATKVATGFPWEVLHGYAGNEGRAVEHMPRRRPWHFIRHVRALCASVLDALLTFALQM